MNIGTPHTKGAGYFINDKETSRPQEADIQTCPHCQAVIKMQEWRDSPAQSFCMKCMAPTCPPGTVCDKETELYGCIPFMKKIDAEFDAVHKLQSYLKLAGLDPPIKGTPP